MTCRSVGLVLGSEIAPEQLRGMVVDAERLGFGELWLSEDCFFTGGVSGAAIALSTTDSIPVGIGVVSAVARHPAILAMEIATLARAFPGRLRPAVGLGVPAWLRQMGLQPRSPLAAVRECTTALRSLLDGERLDREDGLFAFDSVALAYPVEEDVPIQLGVTGPKMLQLSGEIADGTLLSVLSGVDYIGWARQQIAVGAQRAGRDPAAHQVTTFALCTVGRDSPAAKAAARTAVAFYLAAGGPNAITDAYGISDELSAMIERGGAAEVEQQMPDAWVADLAVAGDADECTDKIKQLLEAGSDRVSLFPTPAEGAHETIAALGADVLPRLSDPRVQH